jgi:hypothetical protein
LQIEDPNIQIKALIFTLDLDDISFRLSKEAFLEFEDVHEFVVDFDKNVHKLVELDFFLND